MFFNSNKILLYCILLLIILGGFVYSLILWDQIRFQDEGHYLRMTNNIIKNRIYSYDIHGKVPTTFHPPGYSLILASIISIGGGFLSLRMLNFISLALCIILMVAILKKHGYETGEKWVPLIVLCYPVIFFTASTIYPQIIATALFLLIIYLTDNIVLKPFNIVLTGLIYGALLLISPSFILTIPMMLALPYVLKRQTTRLHFLYFIIGFMVVLTPWIIRNYILFDRLVVLSSNAGKTFILGNSENSEPNKGESVDISKYDREIKRLNLDEIDADRYYREKAFEWIKNNPSRALKLYVLKFFNYFNYRNELATRAQQSQLRDFIMFITYYPLLLLALFRFFLIRRYPLTKIEFVFILFYLLSAFTNALFLPRIRYRLPFDFLLICLVAISLDYIKQFYNQRRASSK